MSDLVKYDCGNCMRNNGARCAVGLDLTPMKERAEQCKGFKDYNKPINHMTHEEMLEAAFWMVGNMDTNEDKAAWWKQFRPYWDGAFLTDNGKAERAQKNSDMIWQERSNEK